MVGILGRGLATSHHYGEPVDLRHTHTIAHIESLWSRILSSIVEAGSSSYIPAVSSSGDQPSLGLREYKENLVPASMNITVYPRCSGDKPGDTLCGRAIRTSDQMTLL